MLIYLYESVINEDESRSPGRLVGEIRCKGDGTPGEFIYFDTCNKFIEVKDVNHPGYNKNRKIVDELDKKMLERRFNEPLNITAGGGFDPKTGIHSSIMKTLEPWQRKTIEYVLEYELPASFGTICGKIIEP
ncbi:MAG: hypothetical protein ABRQ39_32205 [Candidatus Eremiobacterota bacterium]